MTFLEDKMETNVYILPYEKSSIDEYSYVLASGKAIKVSSVSKYDDSLVRIELPNGESAIVNASHLITAARKCVL